jgi:hypothetical protein
MIIYSLTRPAQGTWTILTVGGGGKLTPEAWDSPAQQLALQQKTTIPGSQLIGHSGIFPLFSNAATSNNTPLFLQYSNPNNQ